MVIIQHFLWLITTVRLYRMNMQAEFHSYDPCVEPSGESVMTNRENILAI